MECFKKNQIRKYGPNEINPDSLDLLIREAIRVQKLNKRQNRANKKTRRNKEIPRWYAWRTSF